MIRTAYNNRFRDRKESGSQGHGHGSRSGRREAQPRREGGSRRENSTVVHPWMSLPDRLAATQAAMRELAGNTAFSCPLDSALTVAPVAPVAETEAESKPRTAGVSITIRKRRLPAGMIPSLASAG
jgi:hypothetical protein